MRLRNCSPLEGSKQHASIMRTVAELDVFWRGAALACATKSMNMAWRRALLPASSAAKATLCLARLWAMVAAAAGATAACAAWISLIQRLRSSTLQEGQVGGGMERDGGFAFDGSRCGGLGLTCGRRDPECARGKRERKIPVSANTLDCDEQRRTAAAWRVAGQCQDHH